MPDPWQEEKRAFHYALEFMEDFAKDHLRELDDEQMQNLINKLDVLKGWTQEVWGERPWDYKFLYKKKEE